MDLEQRRKYWREQKQAYRDRYPEKNREIQRLWRLNNLSRARENEKEYHKEHKNKINALVRADRKTNPEKYRAYDKRKYLKRPVSIRRAMHKRWRDNLRREVMQHYGDRCACCGETTYEFLSLDHINNDGSKHRGSIRYNQGNWKMLLDIRNRGYPPIYQILCMNCNWAKRYGQCPHQKINPKAPGPD